MTCVIDAEGRIKEYWGEVALVDLADYAQGSIIRGGAADWEALVHPGTAYHFQTDATDVMWAQNITMADGAWQGIGVGLERIVFNAAGYVSVMGANFGVGTLTPAYPLEVLSDNAWGTLVGVRTFDNVNADAPSTFLMMRARGTSGAPAIVQNGDTVARIRGRGYDGAAYGDVAFIDIIIDAAPGVQDLPGRIVLSTSPDGTRVPVERMRITNAGDVGIGTVAPDVGLHYANNSPQMSIQDLNGAGNAANPWINFGDSVAHDTLGLIGYGSPAHSDLVLVNKMNAGIRFYTNADEVVRFHASGGVSIGDGYVATDPGVDNLIIEGTLGIGTPTPATQLDIGAGAMTLLEMAAPGAGAADSCRLYLVDNGGKSELWAIFQAGAAQLVAAQP